MGWFDEQIRLRKQSDQDIFEDSVFRMASAVIGRRGAGSLNDSRIITKDAVDEVLRYYHMKPSSVQDEKLPPPEQLENALRHSGVMYREAALTEKWYKDSFGPLILYLKESGAPVAAIPEFTGGYKYISGGREEKISSRNADLFTKDALCFYRPLPDKKLGFGDLFRFMRQNYTTNDLTIYLLSVFLVVLAGSFIPIITKILTGFVLTEGNVNILWGTAFFLLCTAISSHIFKAVKQLSVTSTENKLMLALESSMMMRLLRLPAEFFRKFTAGELANRVRSVKRLCSLLVEGIFSTSITSVFSLIFIGQIFRFAPELVMPAVLVMTATLAVSLITAYMRLKITRREVEHSAKLSGLTYSLITGVQKIKLSGSEKRAFAKWAAHYAEGAELLYDPPLFLKISSAVNLAVSLIGMIVMYALSVKAGISPSDYMAFSASYGMLTAAFKALAEVLTMGAEIRPILELTAPILETLPESDSEKESVSSLSGSIELNNVYFRYDERSPYIINGMNLRIKPGEYVAIVGRTGCGKSTLIRLLLGFEMPEKGSVFYDGKDISRIDLRSLRKKIGAVTQDGSLFQGDIYSNIVISAPHLSVDEAWEAAETAGIADDIRAMPMGMNTVISEGQGGISGGQKQRIMIARAIAPKPKILIFDEATSALDNISQKKISESLDGLNCTRIVVAHRLSTIRNCDRIIVMDEGRIAEDGTYEELIAKRGIFAELVERQQIGAPDKSLQLR